MSLIIWDYNLREYSLHDSRSFTNFMSLKTHHITSHNTGFPSHARVPAQNFSNFEPIYMMPCVCSFQIALLFWYVNLRDLLQVWHSQFSRCTVSLDSQTGWWRASVSTMPDRRIIFDNFVHFKFIIFMCILFFITLNSDVFLIVGHPATVDGKFRHGCLLKSSMRSGIITDSVDMARSCRGRLSIGNLQGHTPCVLHCVQSRATSRSTAWFKIRAIKEINLFIRIKPNRKTFWSPRRFLWLDTSKKTCQGKYETCLYFLG